jgi:large subunit ribosomal protein L25
LHIDFLRVGKGTKIHLRVPVVFVNQEQCPGLKKGGMLNVVLHSLDVTCDVDHVPDHLEVDLAGLEIGQSLHTADLNLGKGVSATNLERDNTLATIVAPTVQKAETPAS